MKIIDDVVNKRKCSGCLACYSICTHRAISIANDNEGFIIPLIDNNKCVKCGKCDNTCPTLNYNPPTNDVKVYAMMAKNDNIRNASSSGGVFYLLAKLIIKQGGVVFGAVTNKNLSTVIDYTETLDEIKRFQKSKYVQANPGNSYLEAKRFLDNGRKVLFTGTPCQIAGLKFFLKREYDNLLAMDLICHGVPSESLLKAYLKCLEEKYSAKVANFSFRDKKYGWIKFSFLCNFTNNTQYRQIQQDEPWMLAFNKNIMLKNSCYSCLYKTKSRISDITVGDLWGINKVAPEMNDDKGTSLVLIQSEKGLNAIKSFIEEISYKEIDYDTIKVNNSFHKTDKPAHRDDFVKTALNKSFLKSYKKYCVDPLITRIYWRVRIVLGKIKRKVIRRT